MATFNEFYQTLDHGNTDNNKKILGDQFERFVKWFLMNDPVWSAKVDTVWMWKEWPDRDKEDESGIDLVFRDKDGELWAVQAKCHQPNNDVTKSEMDSFLSESNSDEFSKRLLISSSYNLSRHAERARIKQPATKPAFKYMLDSLGTSNCNFPSSYQAMIDNAYIAPPKLYPQEQQTEARVAVSNHFLINDRAQLIMACGSGKTYTMLWIKEDLESKITLVLVPSLNLLAQTLADWMLASETNLDVLCVCSDKSVTKNNDDKTVYLTSDFPYEVTTNKDDIVKFLNKTSPDKVVFCTYQSSGLIKDAQKDNNIPGFDLAIADEAHNCTGELDSFFATMLDCDKIRATKRLFATATPRTISKRVKENTGERGLACMDDANLFGEVAYLLTFGEAIRRNIICDYRVSIVYVNNMDIYDQIINRQLVETEIKCTAEEVAIQIGILKTMDSLNLNKAFCFHNRLDKAEKFINTLECTNEWVKTNSTSPLNKVNLSTGFISGKMSVGNRQQKLSRFKNLKNDERGIISNVMTLAEGRKE